MRRKTKKEKYVRGPFWWLTKKGWASIDWFGKRAKKKAFDKKMRSFSKETLDVLEYTLQAIKAPRPKNDKIIEMCTRIERILRRFSVRSNTDIPIGTLPIDGKFISFEELELRAEEDEEEVDESIKSVIKEIR